MGFTTVWLTTEAKYDRYMLQKQNRDHMWLSGWECLSGRRACIQSVIIKDSGLYRAFFHETQLSFDHLEDKAFIVVHLGVYDKLPPRMVFFTALPGGAINLPNYFMLPLSFRGGKWITMISIFQNIAWWNMLSYHPGAEVQVCKSIYFWGSGPWRRLPAWCRCLRSHLLPSPTIQSWTCTGGPSGSAVWSLPHQAAQ